MALRAVSTARAHSANWRRGCSPMHRRWAHTRPSRADPPSSTRRRVPRSQRRSARSVPPPPRPSRSAAHRRRAAATTAKSPSAVSQPGRCARARWRGSTRRCSTPAAGSPSRGERTSPSCPAHRPRDPPAQQALGLAAVRAWPSRAALGALWRETGGGRWLRERRTPSQQRLALA